VVSDQLLRRWDAVLPGQRDLGSDLIARWSEPHRHYHDLRHLFDTLVALDVLGPAGPLEELALWFHDAVHTNTAGVDEHRSADLAARLLPAAGVDAAATAEVVRLVLVTVDHRPAAGDLPGARVSDADLAILAAEPARYRASVQALRAELAPTDEQAWRASRLASIAAFATMQPLFHTRWGEAEWEGPARANLAAELADHQEVRD
jgi:predicted metal-dependent HD superfamily phosphohydrolase